MPPPSDPEPADRCRLVAASVAPLFVRWQPKRAGIGLLFGLKCLQASQQECRGELLSVDLAVQLRRRLVDSQPLKRLRKRLVAHAVLPHLIQQRLGSLFLPYLPRRGLRCRCECGGGRHMGWGGNRNPCILPQIGRKRLICSEFAARVPLLQQDPLPERPC